MRKIAVLVCVFIVLISLASCENLIKNIQGIKQEHIHTPSDWIIDVEVTSDSEGARHKYCLECGETLENEVIPTSAYGSKGLEFEFNERKDGYVLTSVGSCRDKNIIIPSTYEGLPVTGIGDRAFEECSFLKSIKIPDTVSRIGKYAFYLCVSLEEIKIPDSVRAVEEHAFAGCILIEEFRVSKNLTELWTTAFMVCNSLQRITVDEENPYYASIDGNLYTKDGKILMQYAIGNGEKTFVIPDTVEVIAMGALAFNTYADEYINEKLPTLESVVIPDSVTVIGDEAFWGMFFLESVYIPESVTTIGANAFGLCTSLNSISLPDSITFIGYSAFIYCDSLVFNEYDNAYYLGNEENPYLALIYTKFTFATNYEIHPKTRIIATAAFADCTRLVSIEIPDSVTVIGHSAFANCKSLKSVTLGKNVKTIGAYAFYSCVSITEIYIPISVSTIGAYAFDGCDSIIFHCEAYTQPSGWHPYWNPNFCEVIWKEIE